jgi:hypothetical protein
MATKFYRRKVGGEYLKQKYGFGSRWALAHLAGDPEGPLYRVVGKVAVYAERDFDAWTKRRLELASTRCDAQGTAKGRALAKARAEAKARKAEKARLGATPRVAAE